MAARLDDSQPKIASLNLTTKSVAESRKVTNINQSNNQPRFSLKAVDTMSRWIGTGCGLAVSTIAVVFVDGPKSAALIALGLVVAAAAQVRGYVAHQKNKERDAKIEAGSVRTEAVSAVARAADTKAATALLGRRLSPEQADSIVAKLAGVDLATARVAVSYIPSATSAIDFAGSLAGLLTRLRVRHEPPYPERMTLPPQSKPHISGTRIMLSRDAGDAGRALAEAIKSEAPDTVVAGADISWPFQQSMYAMKIIVGHKQ